MQRLEVLGANKLKGQINISGSKNASLPILAATLLSKNKITLKNLPKVKDIETMINLLQSLGSITKFTKQSLVIDNFKQKKVFASYNLVKTMRAGILVLGPLLAKFGSAKVSLPGGCAIGTRPVDIHLKALSKLGVKFKILNGYVHANASKGLVGANIRFPKISVGATENLIIAACFAKGNTILKNCAIEPEIKDLVNFLNNGVSVATINYRFLYMKPFGILSSLNDSKKFLQFVRFNHKKFNIDNAPLPKDNSLEVFEGNSGYFAAIKYSGYTNESKEKVFTEKLQSILKEVDIKASGEPVILVYNSPYKLINRRNEIIIPVIYNSSNNNEGL